MLAAERVDTWSAVADSAGIELELKVDQASVVVATVPGAVEQILDNVLDNAISIAPAGSTVTVAVESGAAAHRLIITDHGPGLSDDDKERATRRFWRGDTSRPGSGLGLAIATALTRASGGTLTMSDAAGGGLEVSVRLPAAKTLDQTLLSR